VISYDAGTDKFILEAPAVGAHTDTIVWGGTSVLDHGAAFAYGDNDESTITHIYATDGSDDPTLTIENDDVAWTNSAAFTVEGNQILTVASTSAAITDLTGTTLALGDGGDFTTITADASGGTDPVITFGDDVVTITNAAAFNHEDGSVPTADLADDAGITMAKISGSITFVTTGTITGAIDVVATTGTSDTVADSEMHGSMHTSDNGATVTYTLPEADQGMSACFYDLNGGAEVRINPNAANAIYLDGVKMSDDEYIESPGAPGDFICLLSHDGDDWLTLGRSGTWVQETP
jgi:hypothetical protein